MKIYIDESGSFVDANHVDSWNVVGAFVITEADDKQLQLILRNLKLASGFKFSDEIKLHQIKESLYFEFLTALSSLKGRAICVATDAGLNESDFVINHKKKQVALMVEHIDLLEFQCAKDHVQNMASKLITFPPQMYCQLMCHIHLMLDVLHKTILYYEQRVPMTLSTFKWIIDIKNPTRTKYEDLIEALTPVILQTRSLSDPLPSIQGYSYRGLQRNIFQDGGPTYLRDTYGLRSLRQMNPLNLGEIFKRSYFVDSKISVGIQIIDLIVSGINRCLRKKFKDNDVAAALLGGLMIQERSNRPPIHIISFSEKEVDLNHLTSNLINIMMRHTQKMLLPSTV